MSGISIHDVAALSWESLAGGIVRQKAVRSDPSGRMIGLLALDPLASTGVHKHLDVAFSFHLAGSSSNFTSTVTAGQLGVTLAGTIHETVTYAAALAVVRSEGPTMFAAASAGEHLHTGAVTGELVLDQPEALQCFVVDPAARPLYPSSTTAGLSRRLLFDYHGTGKIRRMVELVLLPGCRVAAHRTTDWIEGFVLAGDLRLGERRAGPANFFLLEPDAQVTLASDYGCRLIAWADGPTRWEDAPDRPDLYGF